MTTRRQFLTTAAPMVAAAAVLPTVLTAGTATHPDAALIAMGRKRAALVAHIDDSSQGHTDEVIDQLCADWKALDGRIMAMVPQSAAGIAVQLAVVWSWLELEPGEEDGPTETSSLDRQWLWTAKLNAERLAGRGCMSLSASQIPL